MIAFMLALIGNKLTAPIAVSGCIFLALGLGLSQVQVHGLKHDLALSNAARDTANQSLGTCRGNQAALQTEITAQNAAVTAIQAEGDRRTAEATKAAQAAEKSAVGYRKRAAVLLSKPPAGNDTCSRVLDVDRRVLEGLEP